MNYLGLPLYLIRRLQMVQNQAARLIYYQARWKSARPLLEKLHWLPVAQRINFKIGCLAFKSLHGQSPQFLQELLIRYTPSRNLCSMNQQLLIIPGCKRKRQGGRRFSIQTSRLWNMLPLQIRSCSELLKFRKLLKTWLFVSAFD